MTERALLVTMRVVNCIVQHPQADYSHKCNRCNEPVCIWPTGQAAISEIPEIEVVCDVCIGNEWMQAQKLFVGKDWRKEDQAAHDFTRKQRKQ